MGKEGEKITHILDSLHRNIIVSFYGPVKPIRSSQRHTLKCSKWGPFLPETKALSVGTVVRSTIQRGFGCAPEQPGLTGALGMQ